MEQPVTVASNSKPTTSNTKQFDSEQLDPKPTISDTKQDVERNLSVENDVKKSKKRELDKFKRRLIRALARLMLVEKKPEEEIWVELKKETNCDCKQLWMRMRALTIKKLTRLIAANDSNENISTIAQLSVTDWMLYDLVLVHEDVDVIGAELPRTKGQDLGILDDLFQLVFKYKIEHLSGDRLTLAWYNLTAEYNSRGRKCSPMLLQRRWYQMKEQVRQKCYSFWYEYRGVAKKLKQADKFKPSELEVKIMKNFMSIVTDPFMSWNELIEEQKICLFSDFERLELLRKKNAASENEPDIQLIEPKVETIDLGVDSDDDCTDSKDSISETKDDASISEIDKTTKIVVKTENIFDICDEDEVNTLESMHIPLEKVAIASKETTSSDFEEKNIDHDEMNDSDNAIECLDTDLESEMEETTFDNYHNYVEESNSTDVQQDIDFNQQKNVEETQETENKEFVMPKITSVTSTADINAIDITDCTPTEREDIVKNETAEAVPNTCNNIQTDSKPIQAKDDGSTSISEDNKEIIIKRKIDNMPNFFNQLSTNDVLMIDNVELEDDGIEYIEDDEHLTDHKTEPKPELDEPTEDDDTPNIDAKLLLTPVVYTKKLDQMDVFRFQEYIKVTDKSVIEIAQLESKPVDKKSVKMNSFCDKKDLDVVKSADTDSGISKVEQEFIKTTSWLFRKPRVKNYNPIQLCKNPDFNTRLKRLTSGFFSSPRNRQLLSQCKPLTIDVHKSFESKLVNDCLLLKKSYFLKAKETETEIESVEKTVIPSELPGSRLNCIQDTTNITINPATSPAINSRANKPVDEVHVVSEWVPPERKKVINLPDIDQIRRANEKLLIAEVTPLSPSIVTHIPPVTIVNEKNLMDNNQNPQVYEDIKTELEPKVLDNATCTTNVIIKDTLQSVHEDKSQIGDESKAIVPSNLVIEKLPYYKRRKEKLRALFDKMPAKLPNKVRTVPLTWTPKQLSITKDNYQNDVLLARDTVERIIKVCEGIPVPIPKKKKRYKDYERKKMSAEVSTTKQVNFVTDYKLEITNEEKVIEIVVSNKNSKYQQSEQIKDQLDKHADNTLRRDSNDASNEIMHSGQTQENYYRKNKRGRKRTPDYCCWARGRIDFLNKKRKYFNLRHNCPLNICQCCCSLDYCDELKRRRTIKKIPNNVPCLNLVSDDESDHNTNTDNNSVNSLQTVLQQELNQTPKMVDVSTNTDYDPEFEKCYAANLNNLNDSILSQPIITSVTSLAKPEISYNGTQTYDFKNVEPEPREGLNSTTDIPNMQETKVPPYSTIPSPGLEMVLTNNELQNVKKKCKTKIVKTKTALEQNVLNANSVQLPKKSNTVQLSPVKVTTSPNKPMVYKNNANRQIFQKAISLGENKILLCSNKTNMVDVTHLANNFIPQNANSYVDPTKLIPKGAHLVLLPNKDLVLALDPGTELDPSKLTHLPSIMTSVKEQLVGAGIINQLQNICTSKRDDVILLSDDEKESTEVNRFDDSSKVEQLKNPEKYLNDTSEMSSLNELNNENVSPIASTNNLDTNNKKETESNELSREKVIPLNNTSVDSENLGGINSSKSDQFTNVEKDTAAKKSILSDLMEMSGISSEDTANIETPLTQQTLHLGVSPQKFTSPRLTLPSEIKGNRDISLLANPFVQSALLKYPDLQIVYSFEDLRFVYANNGQFYKMDIKTGSIAPINVCIKRQFKSNVTRQNKLNVSNIPKSVIDLTEEDTEDINTSTVESKSEESKDASDISLVSLFSSDGGMPQNSVKPIKLFKTFHPSILKRKLPSHKQTEALQISNMVRKRVILNNNENFGDSIHGENKTTESDSDSDNEPLSHKAKRIRMISEDQSTNICQNESMEMTITNTENDQEMEITQSNNEEISAKTYSPNIPLLDNPEVVDSKLCERVIFQFNNEVSSDDDCILGV